MRPASRASATAVLVCQGRAVADGRWAVGRFADPVARRLLDPDERTLVDAVRTDASPPGRQRTAYEMVRRTGITMVPRTVAIDDAVRDHGATQLVVLGAGLDSRAWRMAELDRATVYEVDHPASQRDKQRRVGALPPVAAALVPVAVDLTVDPLAPALTVAGLDPARPTTWVWEGVVPYLTADAVRTTVAALAGLSAPGSRLVVSYQARSLTASLLRRVMRLVLRLTRQPDPLGGEPWRSLWTPDAMRELLAEHEFVVRSDRDLLGLVDGLDLPATDTGSLRNGRVAVADLGGWDRASRDDMI